MMIMCEEIILRGLMWIWVYKTQNYDSGEYDLLNKTFDYD